MRRKTSLWTEDTWGGALVFYSTCFLGHRRNGERGNLFLQTAGLHACSDVGSSILHHILVAKVSSDLFPLPFRHPSSTRSKILLRPSRPPPSSHRPCHHWDPYYSRFLISLSHPSFPFVLYIQYHQLYISLFCSVVPCAVHVCTMHKPFIFSS